MKTIEELFDEHVRNQDAEPYGDEYIRQRDYGPFMAGAAAMASLFAAGAKEQAEPAVWPPPPPPAPPPKCVHGRLFSEDCELCENSGNTRIVPLQSSEPLVPDGT